MRRRGIGLAAAPAASLCYGPRARLGALGRTDDEYVTRVAYDVRYGMIWADTGEKLSDAEIEHYYEVLDTRGFSRTSTPELVGRRWGVPSGFAATEGTMPSTSALLPGEWDYVIDGAGPLPSPTAPGWEWPWPTDLITEPTSPGAAAATAVSWGWILAGAAVVGVLVAIAATRR